MNIISQRPGLPWMAACVAAGLFMVSAGSTAQETTKHEKSEHSKKSEKSEGKKENGTVTATLSGKHEVPAVETNASGKSTIKVHDDKTVTGKVSYQDMTATAAHIHQGPADKDGPVIIPLKKTGDNTFSVPEGTKMTDEQYAAFKEGNLYINVHSKKYPSGEIRAQMKP